MSAQPPFAGPDTPADHDDRAARPAAAPGGADSTAADGAAAERAAQAGEARSRDVGVTAGTALAMALALLATTMAGFLWWQYRQFYVALDSADVEIEAALERVRANDRSVADELADTRAALEASRKRSESLAERLESLPPRFADLERRLGELPSRLADVERRVDAVQGGSANARAAWLRAEAEYYLAVANTELDLGGRWENAVTALELADDRLRAAADPALSPVRERIADELLALRGVALPDLEGLVFGLARLAERVDELPLRASAPASYEPDADGLADAEPGLTRLWLGLKQAVGGLISVERTDVPAARGMSAERQELARRELVLELELARIAALRAQPEAFEASVRAAASLLERDFDTSAAAVEGAGALLREHLAVDVAPQTPDIRGSLALLRSLSAGRE